MQIMHLCRNFGGNSLVWKDMRIVSRVPGTEFGKNKNFLNVYICLVLRLKIFDAAVSPAMFFGFEFAILPLTKVEVCLQKIIM